MKSIVCLVYFLALSFPLSAGPIHFKKPHPIGFVKHHKLLLITSAMFLASDFADTEETIQAQRRCPTCVEGSDLFGPHPSSARLWGESVAFDAPLLWFNWFGTKNSGMMGTHDIPDSWKEKHRAFYDAIWLEKPGTVALMAAYMVAHAHAAYHNAGIPTSASSTVTLSGAPGHIASLRLNLGNKH